MTHNQDNATCNAHNPADALVRLMKAKEVATLMQISPAAVYRMMRRREIPTVKIGRSIRVPYSDLVQWLAERKQTTLMD